MTFGLETEWDYSGRKGRDGQKKEIGKANEGKGKVKRAKDEEVNGQGEERGASAPHGAVIDDKAYRFVLLSYATELTTMISVLVSVLHSLVSALVLVPLRSDLINKPTINEQLTHDVPRDRRRYC